MNKTTSWILGGVAIFLVGFGFGYAVFHTTAKQVQVIAGAVGDTYTSPNSVTISLDTTGTVYGYDTVTNKYAWGGGGALTNSSGRDRNITSIEANCTGLGTVSTSTVTNIGLTMATSTLVASTTSIDGTKNTNYIVNNSTAISTSSPWYSMVSTTTPYGSVSSFATGVSRVWSNNSILSVESPATTSGACWLKLNYISN